VKRGGARVTEVRRQGRYPPLWGPGLGLPRLLLLSAILFRLLVAATRISSAEDQTARAHNVYLNSCRGEKRVLGVSRWPQAYRLTQKHGWATETDGLRWYARAPPRALAVSVLVKYPPVSCQIISLPIALGSSRYSDQDVVTNHPLHPPLFLHRILTRISQNSSACRIRGCCCSIFRLHRRDKGLGSATRTTRDLLGNTWVQIYTSRIHTSSNMIR